MPQPYGLLHSKWLKDAESSSPKATPASCRNSITCVLLSSNGTHIPAKLAISAHQVGRDMTYSVEVGSRALAGIACPPLERIACAQSARDAGLLYRHRNQTNLRSS